MIILFPLSVFVSLVEGAMPVGMHGDPHPPQYSSLSLHLDTYDGPVMIEPSVMGYLNDAEVMSHDYETKLLSSLVKISVTLSKVTQHVIDKVILGRMGIVSSLVQMPLTEPNTGPFPQFNINFEDEPMEAVMAEMSKPKRKYKSWIRDDLVSLLTNSTQDLVRLQQYVKNPRTVASKSTLNKLKAAASFLQDYEQFVQVNQAPFQEISVHAESITPPGGDAPIVPRMAPILLDVNRTMNMMELKLLKEEEKQLLKRLKKIAKKLSRNPNKR